MTRFWQECSRSLMSCPEPFPSPTSFQPGNTSTSVPSVENQEQHSVLQSGSGCATLVAMKRSRVRRKLRENVEEHHHIREAVFERDDWTCQIARLTDTPCAFGLSVHHLKKASQGGKYEESNLTTACIYHNDYIEDHPAWAKANGLVR